MTAHDEVLTAWGWDDRWQAVLEAGGEAGDPARVVAIDRGGLTLQGSAGIVGGRWRPPDDAPAVGDWCLLHTGAGAGRSEVSSRLPRRTRLVRKAAGRATRPQVLAANVDVVLLVCGLDHSGGLRSIERLLTLVLDGGATPVVVLNKADLCPDVDEQLQLARMAAPGFEVLAISAARGHGLDQLEPCLTPGTTAALLGPSGAGKSTLLNALAGAELAATSEVRAGDRRGRHTTTRRELHRLPSGVLLLDTPGLRELAAWIERDGLSLAFADIEQIAESCRFRDCRHDTEPGCAVRQALDDGTLEPRRFLRYLELTKEAEALAARRDARRHGNPKRRFKDISRFARDLQKRRDRD